MRPAGAVLRPGERRHEVVGGGEAAGGLAVDGDQAGVASELADVVPDPGQRHHLRTRGVRPRLVPHTRVAGHILRAEREEAEGPESVSASSRVSALMCYLVYLRMRT